MLSGRSINAELRKSKGYRNPDFLTKIVEHFGIAEHGSGYPRDVFDPTALAPEDFYDAICASAAPLACTRARRGMLTRSARRVQRRRSADRRRCARRSGHAAARWISLLAACSPARVCMRSWRRRGQQAPLARLARCLPLCHLGPCCSHGRRACLCRWTRLRALQLRPRRRREGAGAADGIRRRRRRTASPQLQRWRRPSTPGFAATRRNDAPAPTHACRTRQ